MRLGVLLLGVCLLSGCGTGRTAMETFRVKKNLCYSSAEVVKGECEALVDLYFATGGRDWHRQGDWLSRKPVRQWEGVTVENRRVVKLDLGENNLRGELPDTLHSFPKLKELRLDRNQLSGGLPAALGQLKQLRVIDLSKNLFVGKLPSDWKKLGNVRELDLNGNYIGGEIPPWIDRWVELRRLDLHRNMFAGEIPPRLAALPQLQDVRLSFNLFRGELSPELLYGPGRTRVVLNRNKLTGPLPAPLPGTVIEYLDVSQNQLTGELPTALGEVPTLWRLDVSVNQLTGPLPPGLLGLPEMRWVSLGHNNFVDDLNQYWEDLHPQIKHLDLAGNHLWSGGALPLPRAKMLKLGGNCLRFPPGTSENVRLGNRRLWPQRAVDDCVRRSETVMTQTL